MAVDTNNGISLSGHYTYHRILRTMYPMVLMMLVASVYSIIDGLFVARFVSTDAFGGMNIIWPLLGAVGALGLMTGAGGSAVVSKTLGEGDTARAQRIFSIVIRFTLVVGIVLAALLFVLMPQVVALLGADETLQAHAVCYGRIWVMGLPFYMLMMAFNPFFMVAERPALGTKVMVACGLTNILLDALLIILFGWGLAGAAIASALSFVVGGAFPLYYFARKKTEGNIRLQATGKWTAADRQSIRKSCSNGVSEFVADISLNIVGMCYNWQLMRYIGSDGVVAYGILMYLSFLFSSVFIGYNMGIAQVVSYNYGAQNHPELTSLLRRSRTIIGICGQLLCIVSVTAAPAIASLFVGSGNTHLHDLSTHATRIYMLSFLLCGFNLFASAWFTALGNGKISAVVALVRTLVLELGCVFLLPLWWGNDGIWASVVVAEVLALCLSTTLIQAYRNRYGY